MRIQHTHPQTYSCGADRIGSTSDIASGCCSPLWPFIVMCGCVMWPSSAIVAGYKCRCCAAAVVLMLLILLGSPWVFSRMVLCVAWVCVRTPIDTDGRLIPIIADSVHEWQYATLHSLIASARVFVQCSGWVASFRWYCVRCWPDARLVTIYIYIFIHMFSIYFANKHTHPDTHTHLYIVLCDYSRVNKSYKERMLSCTNTHVFMMHRLAELLFIEGLHECNCDPMSARDTCVNKNPYTYTHIS